MFNCSHNNVDKTQRKVYVLKNNKGYALYRNGKPFTIKGAAGYEKLGLLKAAGGNTIRLYDTLNLGSYLDSAHKYGLAVIAGLPMNSTNMWEHFFKDSIKVKEQYDAYSRLVKKYKGHPALLIWSLGNELDYPYRPSYNQFYTVFNNLLTMIHTDDPDHPVTTSLVNMDRNALFNIILKIPDLDIISFNIFGSMQSLKKDLKNFSLLWHGPFIISEWGNNGHWEGEMTSWKAPIEYSSKKKAELIQYRYTANIPFNNPAFLGAVFFYWGFKQERTHTWFSSFTQEGKPTPQVGKMEYLWKGKQYGHYPDLTVLKLQGKSAEQNIIVSPNEVVTAEIMTNEVMNDSMNIKWEVLPEDWFDVERKNAQKPVPLLQIGHGYKIIKFTVPEVEGPFRIFAEVSNKEGNAATVNTPFYVLK